MPAFIYHKNSHSHSHIDDNYELLVDDVLHAGSYMTRALKQHNPQVT